MIAGRSKVGARRAGSAWLVAGLVALVLAGILAVVVADARSWVQPLDSEWRHWMVDVRAGPLTSAGKALDIVGGGLVMWPLRGVIAVTLVVLRRWRALAIFALAEACAELSIGPIKAVVGRPRPPGALVATTGGAFPSGHALTASVTAVVVVLIFVGPGRARTRWLTAAAGWAVIMALSRTYLSAHWLTDVVAGLLLGVGWALLWVGIFDAASAHTAASSGAGEPSVPEIA
jgi:membrane-associated phospholipid phosphatase